MRSIAIGIVAAASLSVSILLQAQLAIPPAAASLVITYADGRRAANVLGSTTRSFWTTMFPRIDDWQPPSGGEKAAALKVTFIQTSAGARVEVSLLYGETRSAEKHVATTTLKKDGRVEITELTKFGVQPITLSLATVTPVDTPPPTVTIGFPGLEVADVVVMPDSVPRYRVSVHNISSKMARAFSVETFVNTAHALSGTQRGHDGRPVVVSGETYTFDIRSAGERPAGSDATTVTPRPFTLIRISNVLWGDGSFDGDKKWAAQEQAGDLGERLQLARVVKALTRASSEAIADQAAAMRSLQAAAAALLIAPDDTEVSNAAARMTLLDTLPASSLTSACKAASQKVKTALLNDLRDFDYAPPPPSTTVNKVRSWLQQMSDRYGTWLNQLSAY